MKTVFLISPVRNILPTTATSVAEYVARLEAAGCRVHWPLRDTDQNDPIGMRICRDNAHALRDAHEVHVWYEPSSVGSVFDLGMLFMLCEIVGERRPVVIANKEAVRTTDGKSFPNVLLALATESQ